MLDANPLARASDLDFALPPFDRIEPEHLRPALLEGMAAQRAEVDAIAAAGGEATFTNTIEAMERTGALLTRAEHVFHSATSSFSTADLRDLEADVAPLLAAHHDAIHLDRALFERIDAVHTDRENAGLDEEERRLVERYHADFVRAGAALDEDDQQRLRELNGELAEATTTFGNHLLAETNDSAVLVTDEAELAGLSEGARAGAAGAAREHGHDSGWLLTLILSTSQPILASLQNRSLRERVHTASVSRGARGGEHDTRALITRIAALRAERAVLLGFATHAAYVVDDQTAGDVPTVMETLTSIVPAAVANARREAADLTNLLHADGHDGPLQPWDWAYYAARAAESQMTLDPAALREHFEIGSVYDRGVFAAATALYGLTFDQRTDLPMPHPDIKAWQVGDEAGAPLGLFLLDPYARSSKRGGAWMTNYVDQQAMPGDPDQRPVVTNTLNITKPADGQATLLTLDEVRTAFHEFGHALHGLLSDVRYPRLSGTSVPRDFVEYPSQVNEHWMLDPAILASYATHRTTGEALPAEVVEQVRASGGDGQGFATMEILAAMLLDQAWHQLEPGQDVALEDVEAFEAAALERFGIAATDDVPVPPRYGSAYFNHIFGGGYSAGYYSYLWSEILDADTVGWFEENGGLRRENGRTFADALLSRGGAVDPVGAFEMVRGAKANVKALLTRRNLNT